MSIILSADLHDNSCNTRLRPSEALPRIKLQKKRNEASPRLHRILSGALPAQRLELSLSAGKHDNALTEALPPYLRGFAPVFPNFIRRTPSVATGIIVEASPPISSRNEYYYLSANLHDNNSTVRLRPTYNSQYEASPRPYRILPGGLGGRRIINVGGIARQCSSRGFASLLVIRPGIRSPDLNLN